MAALKCRSSGGGYEVILGGEKVAEVIKVQRYYNLHPRPATYTYWRVEMRGAEIDGVLFSLRRDAVEAIADAIRITPGSPGILSVRG